MSRNMAMRRLFGAGLALTLISSRGNTAFLSIRRVPLRAVASTAASAGKLTITALPLATQVFSGKHFVIPVQISSAGGTLSPSSFQVAVVYQLFDGSGNAIDGSSPAVAPVQFLQTDPNNPSRITGTAYIDRAALDPIQFGGQVKYFFRVLQGTSGSGVYLGGGTVGTSAYPSSKALSDLVRDSGYSATVVTTYPPLPVSPAGSAAYVPDTFENDGLTGLVLGPNAVTNAGSLQIDNLDVAHIPAGPNGSKAVVAYNFSLIGTSLQKSAQLVLSYPADLNGQIAGGGNPLDLAVYWWDGVSWRVLARPQIDTTLHTITASLPPPAAGSTGKAVVPPSRTGVTIFGAGEQFEGSFALFPAGAPTSASLRPAERIITPNGDGINDVATFSGLVDGDVVHIFDVRGRRVRTINASNATATQWDGRDDGGSIVDSGVYIYQYTSQGSRVSGVIAVAK